MIPTPPRYFCGGDAEGGGLWSAKGSLGVHDMPASKGKRGVGRPPPTLQAIDATFIQTADIRSPCPISTLLAGDGRGPGHHRLRDAGFPPLAPFSARPTGATKRPAALDAHPWAGRSRALGAGLAICNCLYGIQLILTGHGRRHWRGRSNAGSPPNGSTPIEAQGRDRHPTRAELAVDEIVRPRPIRRIRLVLVLAMGGIALGGATTDRSMPRRAPRLPSDPCGQRLPPAGDARSAGPLLLWNYVDVSRPSWALLASLVAHGVFQAIPPQGGAGRVLHHWASGLSLAVLENWGGSGHGFLGRRRRANRADHCPHDLAADRRARRWRGFPDILDQLCWRRCSSQLRLPALAVRRDSPSPLLPPALA